MPPKGNCTTCFERKTRKILPLLARREGVLLPPILPGDFFADNRRKHGIIFASTSGNGVDKINQQRAKKEYLIEFLNELLLKTLPPKILIVLSVEQQVDKSALLVTKKSLSTVSSMDLAEKMEKICLPSFISHPNGMVLHVLTKSYISALSETKKIKGPSFICHPRGIELKVLNQKQSRIQSPSFVIVSAQKQSTSSSPSSLMEMDIEIVFD